MGYENSRFAEREPRVHRITIEEFLFLDERGAFGDARAELLDGSIYTMSPIFAPHARILAVLTFEVEAGLRAIGSALKAYSSVSTIIDNHSLAEADLVVAEGVGDRFMPAEAIRIAFEVAASSLQHDLVRKAVIYARAGIPEYWVIDVAGRRIVQFSRPVEDGYADRRESEFTAAVTSRCVDGLVIDLSLA